jgi:hypothetical protein
MDTMAERLTDDLTPKFAPFLGMAGVAFAMIFGSTHIQPHNLYKRSILMHVIKQV